MSDFIVIDLGKTLSKVSLWSPDGEMLDRQFRPTESPVVDGIRRLDADGIAAWLVDALGAYAGRDIGHIIPVGHGAGVVALSNGAPAFLPLDYEQSLPAGLAADYGRGRDPFPVTGSPLLPDGLNLGAQLYWLDRLYPDEMPAATLLPWAQYWAWFLSGVAVSEVSSLGCHTDLWEPARGDFSPLARREGWADRFAPLAKASDVVGTLRPEMSAATGLPSDARVLAGLHDSNAALLAARSFPVIAGNESTILSTGTWFVAMRLAADSVPATDLPEDRDTLVNVDVYGSPVPSARFMGGREIESVIEFDTRRVDIKPDQPLLLASVPGLLERGTMLMPTLAPGFGPFADRQSRWVDPPEQWAGTWFARRAAVCLYAALVADASLDLIGSKERLLIEGRFAEAEVFVRALAALRPDTEVYIANAHNDVSFGALGLVKPSLEAQGTLIRVEPLEGDIAGYRSKWRRQLAEVAA